MNSETSFSEYYEWAESQLKEKDEQIRILNELCNNLEKEILSLDEKLEIAVRGLKEEKNHIWVEKTKVIKTQAKTIAKLETENKRLVEYKIETDRLFEKSAVVPEEEYLKSCNTINRLKDENEKLWCVIGKAKDMEIAIRQMDDLYE